MPTSFFFRPRLFSPSSSLSPQRSFRSFVSLILQTQKRIVQHHHHSKGPPAPLGLPPQGARRLLERHRVGRERLGRGRERAEPLAPRRQGLPRAGQRFGGGRIRGGATRGRGRGDRPAVGGLDLVGGALPRCPR